jgi:hypothetical protein
MSVKGNLYTHAFTGVPPAPLMAFSRNKTWASSSWAMNFKLLKYCELKPAALKSDSVNWLNAFL